MKKLMADIICRFAQERYKNAALWRNLWTILLWVFGLTLIIFFILSIIFFIRQDWLPAALVTIGTIVEGAGVKWIVARRTDAVTEEEQAYAEVRAACMTTNKADKLKKDLLLFGQVR